MRRGVRWFGSIAVVVGACARDPAVYASVQQTSPPPAPAEVAAPVTGEVVAVEADASRSVAAALAPQSLFEFSQRLASPSGLEEMALTNEDFVRLFTPRRGDPDDPRVSRTRGDLDGDGQDEEIAVIDGGWLEAAV